MLNRIMEILTPRRMMTVGSLARHVDMDPEELHPNLLQLNADGRIRYALSKCNGSCSNCTTCTVSPSGEVTNDVCLVVDPAAIVISLELRKQDD